MGQARGQPVNRYRSIMFHMNARGKTNADIAAYLNYRYRNDPKHTPVTTMIVRKVLGRAKENLRT